MKHVDRTIKSVQDLIRMLSKQVKDDDTVWFRGQENSTWKLLPTMFRPPYAPFDSIKEMNSIKRFKQNALLNLTDRPSTEAEWMFLMRHHGVPTRLIDWTEAPLVALYFIVADTVLHGEDGALWCLLPYLLNKQSKVDHIPGFDDDIELENYLPSKVRGPGGSQSPIAAVGIRNSTRMYAQQGIFTIAHKDTTAIEEVSPQNLVSGTTEQSAQGNNRPIK